MIFRSTIKLLIFSSLFLCTQKLGEAQEIHFRFPIDGNRTPSRGFGEFIQDLSDPGFKICGFHLAVDVGGNRAGTPVYPMAEGIVKFADRVIGYTVVIEHNLPPGDPAGPFVTTVYYHMKLPTEGGIQLHNGQLVTPTSEIGYISDKYADHRSRPHLHFGIRSGAYRVGKDLRTEKWFYPGYTNIYKKGVFQCDRGSPVHQEIKQEWLEPLSFVSSREHPTCPLIPEPGDTTFPPNVAIPSLSLPACPSCTNCQRFRQYPTVTIQNQHFNGFSDYQFFIRCGDTFDGFFAAQDDTYTWVQSDIGFNETIVQGTVRRIQFNTGCPVDRRLPITIRNSSGVERIAGSITVTSCCP